MAESLPCIVCKKPLEDALHPPSGGNQPSAGLEFTTPGHYGSTIFDMEPGYLVVNICDQCVTNASHDGIVRYRTAKRIRQTYNTVPWTSPKDRTDV